MNPLFTDFRYINIIFDKHTITIYCQCAQYRTKEIIIINDGNNWIITEGTPCRSHSVTAARRNIKGITNE